MCSYDSISESCDKRFAFRIQSYPSFSLPLLSIQNSKEYNRFINVNHYFFSFKSISIFPLKLVFSMKPEKYPAPGPKANTGTGTPE